jgi:hypothetical protein
MARGSFMAFEGQWLRRMGVLLASAVFVLTGCGGSTTYTPPPIILSVSLSNSTVTVQQGGSVNAQVTIDAPTETATFLITGLPGGISSTYKESESNPSGLLTITASALAPIGTYKPTITVGSSGKTASTVFTLEITAAKSGGF